MAAQRYKDILFSYSGLISSAQEIEFISEYFAGVQRSVAQAESSEMMDLIKYTIVRSPVKIKKILKSEKEFPFVFINCLN